MEPPFLPPGFRFHPLDDELVENYLKRKVLDANFRVRHIGEVDLNRSEPWDLPGMARMVEAKEWYFFAVRDRKYPTGKRANRATKAGYWKATGKDKEVVRSSSSSSSCSTHVQVVGMKKTLVFYRGRAPRGEKTNWIMHEYRLLDQHPHLQYSSNLPKDSEWVICRIFKKKTGGKNANQVSIFKTCKMENEDEDEDEDDDHEMINLPPLESPLRPATTATSHDTVLGSTGFADDQLISCHLLQHHNTDDDDEAIITEFGTGKDLHKNALRNYHNNFKSRSSSYSQPRHSIWDGPPHTSADINIDRDEAQFIDLSNCGSISRSGSISDIASLFNLNSTYSQDLDNYCALPFNPEVNSNIVDNYMTDVQLKPPKGCPDPVSELPFQSNTSEPAISPWKQSNCPPKTSLDQVGSSQSNAMVDGGFQRECKLEMVDISEDPLGMINRQRLAAEASNNFPEENACYEGIAKDQLPTPANCSPDNLFGSRASTSVSMSNIGGNFSWCC